MVSNFSSFFDNANWKWFIMLSLKLFDFDSGAESSDSASHNEDIILHDFSLDGVLGLGAEEPRNRGTGSKTTNH